MSPSSNDQILMLLGELKEGLKGVREDMAEVKTAAGLDRENASESRRRIYEKLEEGDRRLMEVESTVRVMSGVVAKATSRVEALEPQVKKTADTVRNWTIRGGAIATAVAAFGGFMLWLISAHGGTIWKYLQLLTTPIKDTLK